MEIQWSLVIFTLLTGLAGWTFFFIGLNEFLKKSAKSGFNAALVSLVLLAVGGFASVTHLSHPTRLLGALGHPTSGIFIEALLVGLLGIVIIAYLLVLKREIAGAVRPLTAIGMVLGVAISFMAGDSYVMASRPAWNTILLPIGYLGTAAVCGAALYWVLVSAEEAAARFAAVCTAGAAVVAAVTAVAYGAAAGAFGGSTAVTLALGVVGLGAVVPAGGGVLGKSKPSAVLAVVVLVAALVGATCYRAMMWPAGTGIFNFFNQI